MLTIEDMFGRSAEDGARHAANLKTGLTELGDEFLAELCPLCEGEGATLQTYTAGCGRGYYKARGPCELCKGASLVIGGKPAPKSVIQQVIVAADAEADYDR